jgi:hypothetical protein
VLDARIVVEQRQKDADALDDGRAELRLNPHPVILEPPLDGLELGDLLGPPGRRRRVFECPRNAGRPEPLREIGRPFRPGPGARLDRRATTSLSAPFLLRASRSVKPRVITRLGDGSRLIRVAVRAPDTHAPTGGWLEVREIRVRVGRPGARAHELRLWTTLVDVQTAPALELARLYASRWEHELYFREVKRELRRTALLQSHTVETGAQEIAAIVLASAVLATERARAARGTVPVLRVRFGQVLNVVRGLWLFFGPFENLMTDQLKSRFVRRGYTLMRHSLIAPRRSRTCPRAVRQPVRGWPRLLHPQSIEGPLHFQVL